MVQALRVPKAVLLLSNGVKQAGAKDFQLLCSWDHSSAKRSRWGCFPWASCPSWELMGQKDAGVGKHLLLGMGASQQSEAQCCPCSCLTLGHSPGAVPLIRGEQGVLPGADCTYFFPKVV